MIVRSIPNQSFVAYDDRFEMYDLRFEDLDGTTYKASTGVTEFIGGLLTLASNPSSTSIDSQNYFGDEITGLTTIDTTAGSGLLDRIGNRMRGGNFAQNVRSEILELANLYSDVLVVTNIKTQAEYASGIIRIFITLRDLTTNADLNFVI